MKFYFFVYRFADVFGLDLADVKTFLDEIPKVPKSAFDDLKNAELDDMESDLSSGFGQRFKVQSIYWNVLFTFYKQALDSFVLR